MTRDVLDKVILLAGLATQDLPEAVRLSVVFGDDGSIVSQDGTDPFLVFLAGLDGLVLKRTESGWIVGVGAVVAVHAHNTVPLVGAEGLERAVNWDRLGVTAQTVTVGVRVGEETGL